MKALVPISLSAIFALFFFSCINEKKNDNLIIVKPNKTTGLSLSQMLAKNEKLIDSVEKRIFNQINERDFKTMFQEADVSLSTAISPNDVTNYFKMIEHFYGKLDTLKKYGYTTTAEIKSIDCVAYFSNGDSLDLNYKLAFYPDAVKFGYIGMNRFDKDAIPKKVLSYFKPKIEKVYSQNYKLTYAEFTDTFKTKVDNYKLSQLLGTDLKKNQINYKITDCKPLIFDKNQVGFLAKTEKEIESGKTKKMNIIFFMENNFNFKIADIQVNK